MEAGGTSSWRRPRALEFAQCSQGNHEVPDQQVVQPLRAVLRIATDNDRHTAAYNRGREKEAFEICQKKIAQHKLEMKLVRVECSFDGNKILFFFTADGRVDFRELVKDLAGVFRARIELRQIGVRDEAKMLGGLGICGRPFCCAQFLDEFLPGVHQDGQDPEPVPEPHQDLRHLRAPDVLPEIRAGRLRGRREAHAQERFLRADRRTAPATSAT